MLKQLALFLFMLFMANAMFGSDANINIKEHPLQRNGYALHLVSYEDLDATQKHSHPDVLLIHGLTYSSVQFDLNFQNYSLARYLARQGFRVWMLDITGYGRSEKPDDGFMVDSDYAAEDIFAAASYITSSQNIDKINLLGWSWGTITSARYAVQHPEQLHRLVLFAPIINGLDRPAPEHDYQTFSFKDARSDFGGTSTTNEVIDAYVQQVYRIDGKGSPNGGRRDLFQPTSAQLLPYQDLKTPTLFIAGDQDSYLDAEAALQLLMQNAPEGSCSVFISGAGHMIFLEASHYQAFQETVAKFYTHGC